MSKKEFKIGIVGGTSLLAEHLIKILVLHPFVALTYISSSHKEGEDISSYHKIFYQKIKDMAFARYDPDFIRKELDLVFIAKPHSEAMKCVRDLYDDQLKIIDLSGDFRLKAPAEYEKWYKVKHEAPALLKKSVYGLTEIHSEEIKEAKLIANPGCYPTGIILSLFPLLKEKVLELDSIFIDSYSGVSGAGRNPVPGKNLFLDAFNNVMAYKINSHQHIPEIEEQFSLICEKKVIINFVPHIVSMDHGIFNTIFVKLNEKSDEKRLAEFYQDHYRGCKFIKVLTGEPPQVKDVVDTNYLMLCPKVNERTGVLTLFSVIDNRIKGGAGQAVQNMNLMLGLPEETGFSI